MTELENFNKVWQDYPPFNKQRANKTKHDYTEIIFSLWNNHRDWKDEDGDDGFQISCKRKGTIHTVRNLMEDLGLLIRVKNHSKGHHTRTFHKNNELFTLAFSNSNYTFEEWKDNVKSLKSEDIIDVLYSKEFENMKFDYINSNLIEKVPPAKLKKLNYDIEKLYQIAKPMLEYYHKLSIQLNNSINDIAGLKLKTFLKFDDNTGLPRGRPFSYFSNTINPYKKHKKIDTSFETRTQFLTENGLSDYYEVYDIKSEIPRVNYLFHTGKWLDDSFDFYQEIINEYEKVKDVRGDIDRGENNWTHYNDSVKQLFMRIYFGKGDDSNSLVGWEQDKKKRKKEIFYDTGLTELDWYIWANQYSKDTIKNDWFLLCEKTREVVKPSIGNLIFWYAFFIEIEVRAELLNRGKLVYNVYDGFYYNEDIKEEIKEVLKEKALFVYEKYMLPIHI